MEVSPVTFTAQVGAGTEIVEVVAGSHMFSSIEETFIEWQDLNQEQQKVLKDISKDLQRAFNHAKSRLTESGLISTADNQPLGRQPVLHS